MAEFPDNILEELRRAAQPPQEQLDVVRLRGDVNTEFAELRGDLNTRLVKLDSEVANTKEVLSNKLDNMRWTLVLVTSVVGIAVVVVLRVVLG